MQSLAQPLLSPAALNTLADEGWLVLDRVIADLLYRNLKKEALKRKQQGLFKDSGIGRQQSFQVEKKIRGDQICWLEDKETPTISQWFEVTQQLQQELNENLFLNINDFECHWAIYPPGQGYDQHLDQHRTGQAQSERIISLILYLNEDWPADGGGELLIYDNHHIRTEIRPEGGRLVLMRSDLIPHAVRPAQQERWSLTGWFRRRTI